MFLRLAGHSVVRWWAAVTWTVVFIVLLVQPASKPLVDVGLPAGPPDLKRELAFAAGHVAGFALLTWLWYAALALHGSGRTALVIAVLVAAIIGNGSEFAQTLTSDRFPSMLDVLANGVGVLVFGALWYQFVASDGTSSRNPIS